MNLSKIKKNANRRLALAVTEDDVDYDEVEETANYWMEKYGLGPQDWRPIEDLIDYVDGNLGTFEVIEWITNKPICKAFPEYKKGEAAKECEKVFEAKLKKCNARIKGTSKRRGGPRIKRPEGSPNSVEECFVDSKGKPCTITRFHKLLFLGFAPYSEDFYRDNRIKNAPEIVERLDRLGVPFPDEFMQDYDVY